MENATRGHDATQHHRVGAGNIGFLILKTLSRGEMHGYAIARSIFDRSGEALQVEEGTLYPALHRLEDKAWISAEWGLSENNRRAKFYRLTSEGRRELAVRVKKVVDLHAAAGDEIGDIARPTPMLAHELHRLRHAVGRGPRPETRMFMRYRDQSRTCILMARSTEYLRDNRVLTWWKAQTRSECRQREPILRADDLAPQR